MAENIPDLVSIVDLLEILLAQLDIKRLDGVIQTPSVRDTNDRGGDDRVGQCPSDGNLSHGHSEFLGDGLDCFVDLDLAIFAGSLLLASRGNTLLLSMGTSQKPSSLLSIEMT
jgi:hypothetical protein